MPDEAHKLAAERKAKYGTKLDRLSELKAAIMKKLKFGWPTEIIARRRKQQAFPFWIYHETIYQFVYNKEGKTIELFKRLLKTRPKREKSTYFRASFNS